MSDCSFIHSIQEFGGLQYEVCQAACGPQATGWTWLNSLKPEVWWTAGKNKKVLTELQSLHMTRLDCQFVYVFMSYKKGEGLILEIILVNLPASLHYNEFSNHGLEHCHFPNKGLDLQLLAEIYSPPNFSHLVASPKSIHLNKYLKILPIAMKRESTVSLKKEVVKLRQESSSQANLFPLQVKPC